MFICVCLGEMMKLEMMMLGSDRKWCDQMVVVECVCVRMYVYVCMKVCVCMNPCMCVLVSEWVSWWKWYEDSLNEYTIGGLKWVWENPLK